MLQTMTPEALIAAESISKHPRFSDFNKMLDAEVQTALEKIVGSRDDVTIHELRGRAKAILELQQAMRDARQTLSQLGLQAPL
jgi:hypothetical protein